MAILSVFPVFLVAFVVRCSSDPAVGHTYHNRNDASQFGELLRPPPPPLLPIIPVPFHGGAVRSQHQNNDFSYQYQVPPPPQSPLPPISPPSDFKFPAPFYKHYNFNFVPTPHPFTTTPSPSMFQKVSQWLFPSQQTADDANIGSSLTYRIPPIQKDCNPCNLAPWIPVIRYDLTAKNNGDNLKQSYGPPALPASANVYNTIQNVPQRFNKQASETSHFSTDSSHVTYGAPKHIFKESVSSVSSTYGPPSPTHTVTIPQENSFTSHIPLITPSYEVSSNSFTSSSSFRNPSTVYGVPSSSIYVTPPPIFSSSVSNYNSQLKTSQLPDYNNFEFISTIKPSNDFELPKVEPPTGFKNSYGEPIVNTNALDIPYSITAAESLKIKTEVLPDSHTIATHSNATLALANPAPFSLNRGRNIHTLQPVALPNLSVSPLPPIFNARPFRRFPPNFLTSNNNVEQHLNNLNIAKSIPLAEIVEYPPTIIQSPVIDIDTTKNVNQTKTYRHIPNSYIVDNNHDITPQASELSPSNSDSSFESTGVDYANDLYDTVLPSELKQQLSVPSNHRPVFADLRGLKDEDIDKYRTDSNLQHIDSPLLYLKPSAPHKKFENFRSPSPSKNTKEYEIYDEVPTTESSPESTLTSAWDETRSYYSQETSPSKSEQNINRSKVVQIIVPYTSGNLDDGSNFFGLRDWPSAKAQPRKVYTNTEIDIPNPTTETYASSTLSTEQSTQIVTESSENLNTPPVINDIYDVKEAPFDIIKLQHTIDDWTQQAYSQDFRRPEKSRANDKYAKQIPDDFFTTLNPITNVPTETSFDSYDTYDHEGSSSIQYVVRENKTNTAPKPFKLYNAIEHTKVDDVHVKSKDMQESNYKLHIYTAASKFRKATTTTTPPPWGHIQTSISPLTKEKVYVVTSKPWRESSNSSNEYENNRKSESQTPSSDDGFDKLPFKSPRFSNRPPIDDRVYLFSKGWHQNINNLENRKMTEVSSLEDGLTEIEEEKLKSDETPR